MRTYQVREGCALPHHGEVLTAGALVELDEAVAADVAVRHLVEIVEEQPVAKVPAKPSRVKE